MLKEECHLEVQDSLEGLDSPAELGSQEVRLPELLHIMEDHQVQASMKSIDLDPVYA